MKYGVLPFRFGRATAEPASERLRVFYREVSKLCSDDGVDPIQNGSPVTIPLTYEMISDAQLMFRISRAYLQKWIEDVDLVLIDLANPSDQILPNHHIVASLAELVREFAQSVQGKTRRFILLLPTMLAPSDPVMRSISEFIESDVLAVLADTGHRIQSRRFGKLPSENDYVSVLGRARGTSAEGVRRKMIRFPGHFKRYDENQHSHCTNYYFDGRLCQAELVDYLDGYVASIETAAKRAHIFYHSTISLWLNNAVEAYSKRRGEPIQNLETEDCIATVASDIILIVPLVDTGGTLQKLHRRIRQRAPSAIIHVLAVLSTRGRAAGPGSYSWPTENGDVRVDYCIRVNQHRFAPAECPFCRAGADVSNPVDPDPFDKLTVHAFWTLCMELGFEAEENVPPYRSSLGAIPAFKKIGEDNGPYLAYKVNKMLRSVSRRLPANPIVICPYEDGVGAIAGWLEAVFGMTVIKVPKAALDASDTWESAAARTPEAIFQHTEESSAIWLTQLRSLRYFKDEQSKGRRILGSPDHSVVILDEINVSGRTRRKLTKLAERFGLETLCYMSLVDFASSEEPQEAGAISLYDVDLRAVSTGRSEN